MINKFHIILLLFLLSYGCSNSKSELNFEKPKAAVQVIKAELKEVSSDISSFGSIVYIRKNDITTAVDGTIVSINVREGNEITKGQEIISLSNMQLMLSRDKTRAAVKSAKAATNLAESQYQDYRRQIESLFLGMKKKRIEIELKKSMIEVLEKDLDDSKQLYDLGGLSKESMDATVFKIDNEKAGLEILETETEIAEIGLRDKDLVNAGYPVPADPDEKRNLLIDLNSRTKREELEVAKAQQISAETELSSIEALIDELSIKSPITGIVGAIYKETGERVESGEKVITVFDSSDAWAVFPVNEEDLHLIKIGMEAEIFIEAIREEPFAATIDIISPTVDPQSGNVSIKAVIKDINNKGIPGMFAKVTVKTGIPEKNFLLPLSSLARRQDNDGIVLTIKKDRIFRRKVSLGHEYKGEIVILSGLEEGELIVREPSPILREGDEVIIYE